MSNTINENQIHIWKIDLSYPDIHLVNTEILSPDEIYRANRLISTQDKKRFIVSRTFLREGLSRYLDKPAADIKFTYNQFGKPSIDPEHNPNQIRFNLSHSRNLVLYAITQNREIGIDVEYVREVNKSEKIVQRFFSKNENEFYYSQPGHRKNWAFFTLWTRKEAYSKAKGMGIGLPKNEIDMEFLPSEYKHKINKKFENESKWSLSDIEIDNDYLAALATEGDDYEIRHFSFDINT